MIGLMKIVGMRVTGMCLCLMMAGRQAMVLNIARIAERKLKRTVE